MVIIKRIATSVEEYMRYAEILYNEHPAMYDVLSVMRRGLESEGTSQKYLRNTPIIHSVWDEIPTSPQESVNKEELCLISPKGIDIDYGAFARLPIKASA